MDTRTLRMGVADVKRRRYCTGVLTRIDHVMICVPDLETGIDVYTRLGFRIYPGGTHPGKGTHNAIAFYRDDYLELLSVRDREEHLAAARVPGRPDSALLEFLAKGGGFRYVIVQSDDLAADVAAMRRRGVDVGDANEGGRRTPAGQELRWTGAALGPANPLPLFFIQHLTPLNERRRQVPRAGDHPNGVLRTDRVYIAVPDVAKAAETYSRVLGIPVPRIQRGTVIKADMAVFDLGPTGLTVAQPVESGPAAEALARQGPGPFQVLYRTSSMEAAARWMADHGVPPPARGIRNTGEQAMLVGPQHACGVYIGLVGPA
jgi:catechol 2,3-dioxygenase-like lactoylglutathione lyase family enzyme